MLTITLEMWSMKSSDHDETSNFRAALLSSQIKPQKPTIDSCVDGHRGKVSNSLLSNVFLTSAGLWNRNMRDGGGMKNHLSHVLLITTNSLICCTEAFKQINDGHMKTGELSARSLRCCSMFMKAPSSEETREMVGCACSLLLDS